MTDTNIWIAAGNGDLARVKHLVESEGVSPAAADENTYTPLHAAVSWGEPEILRYLVSKGADINVVDGDHETPLYVVESAEMARIVIELGGQVDWKNSEGLSPAQSLLEDFPHVSTYLASLTGESIPSSSLSGDLGTAAAAGMVVQPDLDVPTDALLARVRTIMEASERGDISAQETDDQLRTVVENAVNGQVEVGRTIGEAQHSETPVSSARGRAEVEDEEGEPVIEHTLKRSKEEPGR